MTPTGIETATFRFVAQHLNHCATAVPCCLPFVHVVFQDVLHVLLLVVVCTFVVVLCVLLSPYVYLLCYVCIAVFTLAAGLLARSQYPESPATGHLDTGFSWFPCA